MNAHAGDLLLFVGDAKYEVVCDSLAAIRNYLGKELKLYDPNTFDFLWVVDFQCLNMMMKHKDIMRNIIHLPNQKMKIWIS